METKKQLSNSLLKQDNSFFDTIFCKAAKIGRGALPLFCCMLLSQPGFSAVNQANVRQLQQRLIDNPKDVDAHLKLALEYSMGNDFVKAVETYFAFHNQKKECYQKNGLDIYRDLLNITIYLFYQI